MPVQIQLRHDTAANWTSADPTLVLGEVGIETDTDQFKFGDGATAWTGLAYAGGGTATPLDPGDFTEIATPGSPPASGHAFVYAKADGRIYSMDPGGVEYGPFDVAGGGGLYAIDETFPGSSLPAGWTFTGSGSCVVTGGVAQITGAAQGDRLMYAFSPAGQYIVRMHWTNVTGAGGMPSVVALNSSGTGIGVGPYQDGNQYLWNVTTYAYASSGPSGGAHPSLTDVWYELTVVNGTLVTGASSTDGSTWTPMAGALGPSLTITQLGVLQVFTAANIYVELAEMQVCEP